jgi:two-component system sensor histidine kinase PilS (NtrC family)
MPDQTLFQKLSPVYDSKEQLRRHILWLLMLRVILFTLLLAITAFLQSKGNDVILPPLAEVQTFLSIVFIYSIGSAALLQNTHLSLPRFGGIQLISDTIFAALLVYGTGSSQSIFTSIFIFPVISGGLILHRIGGLLPASAATILYALVLYLEYRGFLPPFYRMTNYIRPHNPLALTNLFAVYGVTFFTMALLSSKLAAKLRTTEKDLTRTTLEYDRLSSLYKQIFDDIATGIITINDQNQITSCNAAIQKISGFTKKELLGRPFTTFFPEIILTSKTDVRPAADLQKKDRTITRVGYSFAQLNMPGNGQKLAQSDTVAKSKIITMQDISQVEKMEKKMRKAEKMAVVGELSAAIAHDFRNPLAAISGSAQIMAMDIAESANPDSTSQSLTDIILRESNRMAKTITEFLQFARPVASTPEWFNLKRMVDETILQLTGNNGQHQQCTLINNIPDTLDCWADRQQMQTISLQLLENSCVASKQTTKPISIEAREEVKKNQNVICIQIRDQGTGIDKAIKEKIFTPFFSTREDSTGLGLSIVKQLLEQHKAGITFKHLPQGGCLAEICLPHPAAPNEKRKEA